MIRPATRQKIIEYLESFLDTFLASFAARFPKGQTSQTTVVRTSRKPPENKPFHEAIIPESAKPILAFERAFSTPLGTTYEECARLIGLDNFAIAERQFAIEGYAPAAALHSIDDIIREITQRKRMYTDYLELCKQVSGVSRAGLEKREAKADLYLRDKQAREFFFEMKTPEPNRSQCLSVTRDLLTIHAIRGQSAPKVRTFYGMAYNPYGQLKSSYKWSFAVTLLDMKNQVLLGHEFWDFVGGSATYQEILAIYQEVGRRKGREVVERLLSL